MARNRITPGAGSVRGDAALQGNPVLHPSFVTSKTPMAEFGVSIEVTLDLSSFQYLWQIIYAKYLVAGNRQAAVPVHVAHYELLLRTLRALEAALPPVEDKPPPPVNGGKLKRKTPGSIPAPAPERRIVRRGGTSQ